MAGVTLTPCGWCLKRGLQGKAEDDALSTAAQAQPCPAGPWESKGGAQGSSPEVCGLWPASFTCCCRLWLWLFGS